MRGLRPLGIFVGVYLCTVAFLNFRMHIQHAHLHALHLQAVQDSDGVQPLQDVALPGNARQRRLGLGRSPAPAARPAPSPTPSPSPSPTPAPSPSPPPAPSPSPPPAPSPSPPPAPSPSPPPSPAPAAAAAASNASAGGAAGEPQFGAVEEVSISVQSGHFFGSDFEGLQVNCTMGPTVLNCRYGSGISAATADALWYHIPSMGGVANVRRQHPKQLLIGMSMESSEYYPALDNKEFMKAFDVESSYRTCSQVPVFYFDYNAGQVKKLFRPPVPFDQKKTALAYINSNCGARSGRSDIMRKVIQLKSALVPTESWGHCDRNMPVTGAFDKIELIHGYKFCVAMENSITKDYITEKLWQALEAGCVPVYMGPKNVVDFLPDPEAIIDYHKLGSPEALIKELERLSSDRAAYEAKLAWKFKAWKDLAPSFLAMTERSHVSRPHSRCQLCQLALRHRARPQKYTTCLFNKTWTQDYHIKA